METKYRSDKVFNLSELNKDGQLFCYNHRSGELNEVLAELIGSHEYKVELTIKHLGNAYEVRGTLKTTLDLPCSRCGVDVDKPLMVEFYELLIIDDSTVYTNGSQSRQNYSSDNSSEVYCHTIESNMFDIGEYLHEQIAINTPYQALGSESCYTSCSNFTEAQNKGLISTERPVSVEGSNTHKPFKILGNIKLNS